MYSVCECVPLTKLCTAVQVLRTVCAVAAFTEVHSNPRTGALFFASGQLLMVEIFKLCLILMNCSLSLHSAMEWEALSAHPMARGKHKR